MEASISPGDRKSWRGGRYFAGPVNDMRTRRNIRKTEFGDFQTPIALSERICDFLFAQGIKPASILEPTCGKGNLLLSALDRFVSATKAIGIDINPAYIGQIESKLARRADSNKATVLQGDFFRIDWKKVLDKLPEPILIIGNPPWVTNSELASLGSQNLPEKANLQGLPGLDAITGKSNFDISEWMLLRIFEWIDGRDATVAMLCKTAVARKVFVHAWRQGIRLGRSRIYLIDAQKAFGASVTACLLICDTADKEQDQICTVYSDISEDVYETTIGFRDNRLIARVEYYERWKHLAGKERYRWRSGIKHDCSIVMELRKEEHGYRNKLGELYDLEDTYIYPMFKSSDIARAETPQPSRWMLVTQRTVGESTTPIRYKAPKTWAYLNDHDEFFAKRKSSVYKNRSRFSIFGVGEYSFAPWKVAISGLYKQLHFAVVGPHAGKPVVFDDTCYFIPCQSEEEAQYLTGLLNSGVAKQFFESFIFWDAKRPVTIDVLKRLDLVALARELGTEDTVRNLLSTKAAPNSSLRQLALFT
jgi:methylase of polypeptide subunit release factors